MKTNVPQHTIRGIPQEVDRALRERAKLRKMSINQIVIEELTMATVGRIRFAGFYEFVGG